MLKGTVMYYDYVAIPDQEVPSAVELAFQHVVSTYVAEADPTYSLEAARRGEA
jgi:hypothetical protein